MPLEFDLSSEYEKALYEESDEANKICPPGAFFEPLPDGTHKPRDKAAQFTMEWLEYDMTAHPELPKIEGEFELFALELPEQASAESKEPEEQRRTVLSEQPKECVWAFGPAPWHPFLKPAASEAPKGGKPPRKKPAAATLAVHKLALTPDLPSKLQAYVDGRIAELKKERGQFRMVENGKLIAKRRINKKIPSGALLCIYDDESCHRVANSRTFTRATGPDRDARSFCMCGKHFKQMCMAITTAALAGAKP